MTNPNAFSYSGPDTSNPNAPEQTTPISGQSAPAPEQPTPISEQPVNPEQTGPSPEQSEVAPRAVSRERGEKVYQSTVEQLRARRLELLKRRAELEQQKAELLRRRAALTGEPAPVAEAPIAGSPAAETPAPESPTTETTGASSPTTEPPITEPSTTEAPNAEPPIAESPAAPVEAAPSEPTPNAPTPSESPTTPESTPENSGAPEAPPTSEHVQAALEKAKKKSSLKRFIRRITAAAFVGILSIGLTVNAFAPGASASAANANIATSSYVQTADVTSPTHLSLDGITFENSGEAAQEVRELTGNATLDKLLAEMETRDFFNREGNVGCYRYEKDKKYDQNAVGNFDPILKLMGTDKEHATAEDYGAAFKFICFSQGKTAAYMATAFKMSGFEDLSYEQAGEKIEGMTEDEKATFIDQLDALFQSADFSFSEANGSITNFFIVENQNDGTTNGVTRTTQADHVKTLRITVEGKDGSKTYAEVMIRCVNGNKMIIEIKHPNSPPTYVVIPTDTPTEHEEPEQPEEERKTPPKTEEEQRKTPPVVEEEPADKSEEESSDPTDPKAPSGPSDDNGPTEKPPAKPSKPPVEPPVRPPVEPEAPDSEPNPPAIKDAENLGRIDQNGSEDIAKGVGTDAATVHQAPEVSSGDQTDIPTGNSYDGTTPADFERNSYSSDAESVTGNQGGQNAAAVGADVGANSGSGAESGNSGNAGNTGNAGNSSNGGNSGSISAPNDISTDRGGANSGEYAPVESNQTDQDRADRGAMSLNEAAGISAADFYRGLER